MAAYFCTETGIRITAPGVHKSIDPVNGFDACFVDEDGEIKIIASSEKAGSDEPKRGSRKAAKDDGAAPATAASIASSEKAGSDK